MRGNINNLMKQAQAMQANMQKAQAEIATIEVIGEAGGGMVKVTMTGKHEVKRVQIEPAVISEDRDMLEDLIAAAANDAVHKVEARVQEKMASLTAGLQLPPGMKLPFCSTDETFAAPLPPDRSAPHPAGGRTQERAAHGVPPPAGGPARRPRAHRGARGGARVCQAPSAVPPAGPRGSAAYLTCA